MAHKDCSMQSNAIHVEEKDLLPRHHWITFSEGWAELNPVRNQNLYHHCQVGVKLQLTLHLLLLTTLQLAHLPSFLPPPVSNSSCLFTRCQPLCAAVVLYYYTFKVLYCKI